MVEDSVDRADSPDDDHGGGRHGRVSGSLPPREADDGGQIKYDTPNTKAAPSTSTERVGRRETGNRGLSGSGRTAARGERTANRTARIARTAGAANGRNDFGRVSLVGAGPGHPDLLTKRAYDRLATADVVFYDALTSSAVVEDLTQDTEIVDVGKRPPNRTPQNEINALLCERSKRGERVVRLKGGDPCLFGRGGEEAEHLASEGVPFEVVPGVSSALAAPGVGAIPLTHREHASSVTVITGHETPDKEDSALDWDALADVITAGGTLVILMGVARLAENVRALVDHDVPPETPAATIQKATWDDEETVVASVGTIAEWNEQAGIESPAVTVVGDVVAVREAVEPSLRR
jgi:uroporphyrin-III C-methyltransferase